MVGTVTHYIYDHHFRMLPIKLMDIQHGYHDVVIVTTHAHLDHHTCLEVVVLRGPRPPCPQIGRSADRR